jgi:hypothetical protein
MEFTQEKHKNFYIKKMYENNAYIFVSYEDAKIKGWWCNAIPFGFSFFLGIFYNHTKPFLVLALAKILLRDFHRFPSWGAVPGFELCTGYLQHLRHKPFSYATPLPNYVRDWVTRYCRYQIW